MSHTSKATIRHYRAMRFTKREAAANSLARVIRGARFRRFTTVGIIAFGYALFLICRFLS